MAKSRAQAKLAYVNREDKAGHWVSVKFAQLLKTDEIAGMPLIVAAVLAIIWANSPWSGTYHEVWNMPIRLAVGLGAVELNLHDFINDLLMPLFFFVVGLELKHELTIGELSSWKRAAMPLYLGLAGMVVPAAIYAGINLMGEGKLSGWAIPIATDIAFVLAILILLGDRLPAELRVLTLAFAAVDDIAGVLAIAFFYTDNLSFAPLAVVAVLVLALVALQYFAFRGVVLPTLLGVTAIMATYSSGVHTTIAGVILGLLDSARTTFSREEYAEYSATLLEEYQRIHGERTELEGQNEKAEQDYRDLELLRKQEESVLGKMEALTMETESSVERISRIVNPWVSYIILPLFALANAGLTLNSEALSSATTSLVAWGTFVGLLIGKPLGLLLAAYGASKTGLADLPANVDWRALTAMALLAGIGFTVSLFIAGLAFQGDPLEDAKLGVLSATLIATILGIAVVFVWPRDK